MKTFELKIKNGSWFVKFSDLNEWIMTPYFETKSMQSVIAELCTRNVGFCMSIVPVFGEYLGDIKYRSSSGKLKYLVDTTLALGKSHEHGDDGYNKHSEYVGYNITGAWCTFINGEPECPVDREINFIIVKKV